MEKFLSSKNLLASNQLALFVLPQRAVLPIYSIMIDNVINNIQALRNQKVASCWARSDLFPAISGDENVQPQSAQIRKLNFETSESLPRKLSANPPTIYAKTSSNFQTFRIKY